MNRTALNAHYCIASIGPALTHTVLNRYRALRATLGIRAWLALSVARVQAAERNAPLRVASIHSHASGLGYELTPSERRAIIDAPKTDL